MADTLTLTNPIPVTGEGGGSGGTTRGTVFVHPSLNEDEAYELDLAWNEINTALENGSMVYLEVTKSEDENFVKNYHALINIGRIPLGYMVTFDGDPSSAPTGPYASDSPDGVLAIGVLAPVQ